MTYSPFKHLNNLSFSLLSPVKTEKITKHSSFLRVQPLKYPTYSERWQNSLTMEIVDIHSCTESLELFTTNVACIATFSWRNCDTSFKRNEIANALEYHCLHKKDLIVLPHSIAFPFKKFTNHTLTCSKFLHDFWIRQVVTSVFCLPLFAWSIHNENSHTANEQNNPLLADEVTHVPIGAKTYARSACSDENCLLFPQINHWFLFVWKRRNNITHSSNETAAERKYAWSEE